VSPCGSALGSIYDAGPAGQTGATTVLEQQDLWLLLLDAPPAAQDAYFAGWDASGATINGGYTVHLALGQDQQYVGWSGTDILEQIPGSTLGAPYDSTFWGVVNGVGNLGAGGSGSALFSPNNQVVGTASLAQLTGGPNTSGTCPVASVTPSPSTVTALFTALSGSWTSTADRTSSTGSKTLQSVLDPGNTGATQISGIATTPITLSSSSTSLASGNPLMLSWVASGATTCTASGGSSGDGWAGPQSASGSVTVTNSTGGTVTYTLSCLIGQEIGIGSVVVNWDYIPPTVTLTGGSNGAVTLGITRGLNWGSNVQPCVASGGFPGDGWAGPQPTSGSFPATATQVGFAVYTLTCGTGTNSATASVAIYGVAPYETLVSNTPQVKVGSIIEFNWFGYGTGAPCTPSGGSATDGWVSDGFGLVQNGSRTTSESAPGTYTYTLNCTGGGQTASASQTVVVVPGTPTATLAAANPQQQVGTTALNLLWTSDFNGCGIDFTPTGGGSGYFGIGGEGTAGAASDTEQSPGSVTYALECPGQTATATTTIDWVATPAPVALSTPTSTWAAQVSYPVTWSSNSGPCTASGGTSGDGWAGAKAMTGTQSIAESQQGTYEFTLTCGSGGTANSTNLVVQVPVPFIQMYSSMADSPSTGQPQTTITWSTTVGPCTYTDGSATSPTGVSVSPVGSAIAAGPVSGLYAFTLRCGSGANTLYAATVARVQVNPPTTLTVSATTAAVDTPITITWTSAGGICYASGGTALPPWVSLLPGNGSGSMIVTSPSVGSVTYGITCNGLSAQATVNYTAVPATSASAETPAVTLSSADAQQTVGLSVSLTWISQNSNGCSASGGNPGDGWSGTLATSGSMTVTEASAGTVSYSVTCTGAPPAATATTSVVFVIAKSTSSGGSGGASHGGGALDPLFLLTLGMSVGVSLVRRRPEA
jgi:hypothetical protein